MRNPCFDVKAKFTLTGKENIFSGYRPAFLIGDYLTTGRVDFETQEMLKKDAAIEGVITFIAPEEYPHSLDIGMRIFFQEGAKVVGYAEILEIYNDILNMKL